MTIWTSSHPSTAPSPSIAKTAPRRTDAAVARAPMLADMRLLVVEDDPGMASFLSRALAKQGYSVVVAGTGEDALWNAGLKDPAMLRARIAVCELALRRFADEDAVMTENRRRALAELAPRGDHFDVLPEIAALAIFRGHRVREVPFHYHPRVSGVSKARALGFAPSYVRTLFRCLAAKRRRADGQDR